MREDLQGHSPYGALVGTTVLDADSENGTIEVQYVARVEFTNRHGTVSGGMLSAMLDSVTGLAALVALPADLTAAHTSLQIDYLRPARPGTLIGHGKVVSRVDRDIRCEGELQDAEGIVVARGRASLRVLRKKQP